MNRRKLTWMDDWREFFNLTDIVPDFSQDIPEQFNCLSRIIIFLIIFLSLVYGVNRYVVILYTILLGMILLYIIFYKNSPVRPMKEMYEPRYPTSQCVYQPSMIVFDSRSDAPVVIEGNNTNPSLIDAQQANVWCKPDIPLDDLTGLNQSLAGGANPKTRVMPVIPPPIYDQTTWTPNDFVVPFKINDQRRQELSQNGYMTWEKEIPMKQINHNLFDTYACDAPQQYQQQPPQRTFLPRPDNREQQQPPQRTFISRPDNTHQQQELRENYAPSGYGSAMYDQQLNKNMMTSSVMDTACGGYFPQNARYNYPVNVQPTPCTPQMSEYNKNLYRIPLQPNIYTQSQINQPDASMANLGISFTQPHLPSTCRMDDRGNMLIDEYDPYQYPSEYISPHRNTIPQSIPRHEIYDPRLTGYGTSYRSYNDELTGQPRFYYDDVDAHTQYNFLSRNKIDFTNFAPNTGPYPGLPPDDFRGLADQTFHNDSMKQRTELQYRLMAKNSHREWQQRSAPIQRMGYSRAGCGMQSAPTYAGPRGGC